MDYIRLPELINTYPQPGNYIKQSTRKSTLFGIYDDVNKLDFELPNLNTIKIVNNTSFRFILGIRKNKSDRYINYFTSRRYMLDLRESQEEGNPYFSQFSLLKNYIVVVDWENFDLLFGDLVPVEFKQGVLMQTNNCIQKPNPESETTFVNYELLAKYVDWVVSAPTPAEIGSDGVIPAPGLGGWYEGEYNPTKGYFTFDKAEVFQNPEGTGTSEDYGKKVFSNDPKIKYAPFSEKGKDLQFKKVDKTGIWYYWNESLQIWQKYGFEEPPKNFTPYTNITGKSSNTATNTGGTGTGNTNTSGGNNSGGSGGPGGGRRGML
jgi:hypothetical protein